MSDSTRRPTRRTVLASAAATPLLATAGNAAAVGGAAPAVPMETPPALAFSFVVHAGVAAGIDLGIVGGVRKRLVPITGGTFSGPQLSGTVLPGGGDWQDVEPDGTTRILARYTLRTTDGTLIGVENPGVRRGPADVIRRLAAGEAVDPSLYYFRTTPRFTVTDGQYAWLGRSVFVGTGIRRASDVEIRYFAVA